VANDERVWAVLHRATGADIGGARRAAMGMLTAMDTLAPPPARPAYDRTARRIGWDALPAGVRAVISARVGGQARAEASAGSGFTSGFAARVRGRSGCWFVKAAGTREAPFAAESYLAEARINVLLPAAVPAPRLR
jgi:hypothetical protein